MFFAFALLFAASPSYEGGEKRTTAKTKVFLQDTKVNKGHLRQLERKNCSLIKLF